VARLTRPVIAAIQGDAVAEGLELALACDLRVVSDRAHFAMPQMTAGRLPAHGGTQRLPRVIGRTRALDLLLTGRTLDAREAESFGLVSRVAPHDDLQATLAATLAAVKDKGPIALRYAKEAVLKGNDLTLDQGIRLEEDLYVLLQTTQDRAEGVRAFLQKRKPVFRGK
jgi:enoyl-CoA hydratase